MYRPNSYTTCDVIERYVTVTHIVKLQLLQ